ncbi:hypothetical protein [Haliangium sp.]|uniref:hypothetical protein n=1 Tax=Haliangium sp. TaxID=2663208 RepID=UPI003D0C003F
MASIQSQAIQDTAAALAQLIAAHEAEVARVAEANLFPEGAPEPLSIAAIIRSQAAMLSRSAEDLARADIAYHEALEQAEPHRVRSGAASRLSPEVAGKVARSAEFERIIGTMADSMGASMEQRYFPDGVPPTLTLRGLFESMRARLEHALSRSQQAPSEDEITEELDREIKVTASFLAGFAELADKPELAAEIVQVSGIEPAPI